MPSKAATSYFHHGSIITYPNPVVIDLRIPCILRVISKGLVVMFQLDSRAQSWHQIYLLHELWPKNDDNAKLRYIQKATKSFAYDEHNRACKKRLDRVSSSTADFYGENHHLHYFTREIPIIVSLAVRLQVFYKIIN